MKTRLFGILFSAVACLVNMVFAQRTMSVNFGSDKASIDDVDETVGFVPVPGRYWTDVTGGGNTGGNPTTLMAFNLQNDNGMALTGTQLYACSAGWTWARGSTASLTGKLLYGYLDDNAANPAGFKVTGIPFARYRVIIYRNGDHNDGTANVFRYHTINNVNYSYVSGVLTTNSTANWGTVRYTSIKEGENVMIVSGLTGDLTVLTGVQSGGARACISGFQVQEVLPVTWSGLAADNNWSNSTNWWDWPITGSNLFFVGTTRTTALNNDFVDGTVFSNITFDTVGIAGNTNWTITGNAFTLSGNLALKTWQTASMSTPMALQISPVISVANNGTMTLSGVLSNAASGTGFGVTKDGGGLAIFAAANTYSGQTLVTGGTLRVSSTLRNSSLFTASTGGTLEFGAINIFVQDHSTAVSPSRIISADAGTIYMNAIADTRIANVSLKNGSTWKTDRAFIAWDVLVANNASGVSTVLVSGAGASYITGSGGIRLLGVQVFNIEDTTASENADLITSAILGPQGNATGALGGISKQGAGTMALLAANTFNGALIIESGAVWVGTNTTTGTLGTGPVTNNATLVFNRSNAMTVDNALAGSGTINQHGSGTLTLGGDNSGFTGTMNITNGTVVAKHAGIFGASTVNVSGKGVIMAGTDTSTTLAITNLTFNSGSAVTVGTLANFTNAPAITVTSTLTLNGGAGTVIVNLPSGPIDSGTYHLIAHANTLGDISCLTLGTQPTLGARQSALLVDNAGVIDYVVSGVNPYWTGALNSEWSLATLADPKNLALPGGSATDFMTGDIVTFDDVSTSQDVSIASDVLPAAVIFNNPTKSYTLSGSAGIAGTAYLTKNGSGALVLNTTNSYSGGSVLSGGTVTLGNGSALGSGNVRLTAGVLDINGATVTNAIALEGGTVTDNGTLSGVLSATGALAKSTGATLALSGANTYSGGTTISAGTLILGNANALGTGPVTFNSGVLDLGGLTVSKALAVVVGTLGGAGGTSSGAITGGAVIIDTTNTVSFSTQKTYTNGTTITAGTLALTGGGGSAGTIRGIVNVNTGATLRLSANDVTGYSTGVDRISTINLNYGTMHITTDASIAGNNQTLGSATINMTGGRITGVPNSNLDFFAGGSTVNCLASPSNSVISGTKVVIRQTQGVVMTVEDGTTADGIDLDIPSKITNLNPQEGNNGSNPLIKAGPGWMRLTATNNNYTGATIINAGTLEIGLSGCLGNGFYAANITNGAALLFNSSATQTLSGVISGAGSLTKMNSGTLLLNGLNTYSGATLVSGGTLGGTGTVAGAVSVTGSSRLAPGASTNEGGTLALGALTLASTAALAIDDPADRVTVTGDLVLDENTSVTFTNEADFDKKTTYTILSYTGTLSGKFKASSGIPKWVVKHDEASKTVLLLFNNGSLIRLN
jgi:autotransporter-associated beta strand protein